MLYQVLALTIKDLKILLRDRSALAMLFIMPIAFILIMTAAGMGNVGSSDRPISVLMVNQDTGDLAARAVAELRTANGLKVIDTADGVVLTREAAEKLVLDGQYPVAVVVPADFSSIVMRAATDSQAGEATVTFIADPATTGQLLRPVQSAVQGFVERTVAYAQSPRRIEAGLTGFAAQLSPDQASLVKQIGTGLVTQLTAGDSSGSSGVRFEQVVPPGIVAKEIPKPAEQNVPGYTIFGVFFIITALAGSLLREKQDGTFRRLLAAPLSRSALLLGKLLPYYIVNLMQVTLMFAIGVFVFQMNLGHDPLALIVVTLATAAAATGLGLLVATMGKTQEQIGGLAALLGVILAALGGMMFPAFAMPQFMQTISHFTPHAWALAGYQDVIVRGLGLSAVLGETGMLMGFAAVFFGFALWRFRFD